MCNRQNLPHRVRKAHAAVNFARVTQRDREGRIRAVEMPGSEAKRYLVIIRRKSHLSTELLLDTGSGYTKPHFAHRYITYHAMAALLMAAEENDYRLAWCANREDAERRARLDGRVLRIHNFDNPDVVEYAVLYDCL